MTYIPNVLSIPTLRPSWQKYALMIARAVALRSEDPYKQVGACLLRHDKSVASVGYNGAPSGVELDWTDRHARRPFVIHAETNALRYARPGEVWLAAITLSPCPGCVANLASYGITEVVYEEEHETLSAARVAAETFNITLQKI